MCSLRSEGPRHFIPNTVENQKRFSLYFHKITHQRYNSPTAVADVVHSAALCTINKEPIVNEKKDTNLL